jgi:glycosyltransferase involved in cell wall biosynthesis
MTESRSLRVCFPFVGDTIGGSHLSALLLAEGLGSLGVETLIVLHKEGPLSAELDRRGIAWRAAPETEIVGTCSIAVQPFRMLRSGMRLKSFLRETQTDVVHTNDLRMSLTWGMAARFAGAKFVWHQRAASGSPRLALYSLLTHGFLTISDFSRRSLWGRLSRTAMVIDNPFDTRMPPPNRAEAKSRLCSAFGIPPDRLVVGFVGNFYEQKRVGVFLDMAVSLKRRFGKECFFPMFGEPHAPLYDRFRERVAELDMQQHVVHVGAKFPIEPWLAGCDFLVAPAKAEAFGRVLVEAMLVGTPVIASRHGGHVEIVEHGVTGYLVSLDDVDAFATAIMALVEDPVKARGLAMAAEQRVRSRFSIRRHAEQVLSIYRGGAADAAVSRVHDVPADLHSSGGREGSL